jgi:xanthine dehydrogenase molybdenum-binding subunit
MKNLNYVGKSLLKEDSRDKSAGKTKFICDMQREGMLYAKLLLSEKPHAHFSIDTREALAQTDIIAIYTYADIPKKLYNSHQWYPGIAAEFDEYLLSDKARFMGDRIALVVGKTKEAVERAIPKVKVHYTELPAVIGLEAASQIAFSKEITYGDYEKQFEKADYIIKDSGCTPKVHHAALEPHICLSELDDQNNLVVWTPCQTVFQIQHHISSVLDLPYNQIRVIKAVMGGSFGGKGQTVLEPICAFATHKLQKPVMLYMDRRDAILGTRSRNAAKMTVETAVDKDGKILARKVVADIDGGAYYTNAATIVMALGKKLFRLYDMKDQYYKGSTYYTHTISGGACRGYGSPQAHAITEINMDHIAKVLSLDPCELRLRNFVSSGSKDLTGAPDIGNAQIRACVLQGMATFAWQEKRQTIKNKNTARYAYGVGMACGVHGNGYKGAYPDFTQVDMSLLSDGSILVKISVHDQGCGTLMTMQQIAAEALDIDTSRIKVLEADTFMTPYDSAGTQASRVTFVCGGAVKAAGEKLKTELINALCELKDCSPDSVETKDGCLFIKGNSQHYTYGDIAVLYELKCSKKLSVFVNYESPANPASFAAFFAEVRVDKYTGEVTVLDCLAVHDIGQSINPALVEGQIQGGAHMSLGMALFEKIEIDTKGYVKSTNFSKYHLMNAPVMPHVQVLTVEHGEPYGPYGAKSVGELAAVAPAPAVVNAINFALDTSITSYPVTPEVIISHIMKET